MPITDILKEFLPIKVACKRYCDHVYSNTQQCSNVANIV